MLPNKEYLTIYELAIALNEVGYNLNIKDIDDVVFRTTVDSLLSDGSLRCFYHIKDKVETFLYTEDDEPNNTIVKQCYTEAIFRICRNNANFEKFDTLDSEEYEYLSYVLHLHDYLVYRDIEDLADTDKEIEKMLASGKATKAYRIPKPSKKFIDCISFSHEDIKRLLDKKDFKLKAENQQLKAELAQAKEQLAQAQKEKEQLKAEQGNNQGLPADCKEMHPKTKRTAERIIYALVKLTKEDNSNPYSKKI